MNINNENWEVSFMYVSRKHILFSSLFLIITLSIVALANMEQSGLYGYFDFEKYNVGARPTDDNISYLNKGMMPSDRILIRVTDDKDKLSPFEGIFGLSTKSLYVHDLDDAPSDIGSGTFAGTFIFDNVNLSENSLVSFDLKTPRSFIPVVASLSADSLITSITFGQGRMRIRNANTNAWYAGKESYKPRQGTWTRVQISIYGQANKIDITFTNEAGEVFEYKSISPVKAPNGKSLKLSIQTTDGALRGYTGEICIDNIYVKKF